MTRTTFITHRISVVLMGVAVLVATGDGFAQSYAGLRRWAIEHHLSAWKADSFPLLVDLFIAVGELGLFALALEGHRLTRRGLAWADLALPFGIAAAGWGVSLAFNVGAVGPRLDDQLTAAVPPVASMLGLLVLLRTLHRLVTTAIVTAPESSESTAPEAPSDDDDPEPNAEESAQADPSVIAARERFCDVLSMGAVPSVRAIRRELRVGHPRAVNIHKALTAESVSRQAESTPAAVAS